MAAPLSTFGHHSPFLYFDPRTIMEQPYPMQFARSHNHILLHREEGRTVRVFDLAPGASMALAAGRQRRTV